jgi:cytochrome P450
LITHMLWYLLAEPRRWAALCADSQLATKVVEEILRLDCPAKSVWRTTLRDAEIGGVRIPAGQRVSVLIGSANRDEARFVDADKYDLDRPNLNSHLAFGLGIHFCLGAPLARLEGRIALEVLASQLPGLKLDPAFQMTYRVDASTRLPRALPLQWRATATTEP